MEIQSCNFFELFSFNEVDNLITRVDLKFEDIYYKKGFEFKEKEFIDKLCEGIDKTVILFEKNNIVNLHMFVDEGISEKKYFNPNKEEKLFKFSKLKYLKESLIKGKFLLRPTAYYLKKENNTARLDNEHKYEKHMNTLEICYLNKNLKEFNNFVQTNININLNQYILCMAHTYDNRLYDEFEADSCLIITNTEEFYQRIARSFDNYECIRNRIYYSKVEDTFGILFMKNIKYKIQKEYRYLWYEPDKPICAKLESLINDNFEELKALIPKERYIEIGSIEDIAFIIDRNGNKIVL